jgi:hypothetical protein
MAGVCNLTIGAQGSPEDAFMNFAALLVLLDLDNFIGGYFAQYLGCHDKMLKIEASKYQLKVANFFSTCTLGFFILLAYKNVVLNSMSQ